MVPMSATLTEHNQTAILSRLPNLDPAKITPEVARFILDIELSSDDARRLNELAQKARDGQLSPEEERAIEEFRRAGHVMELLKLKARLALQRQSS